MKQDLTYLSNSFLSTMHFPQSQSKNIIIGILTLGSLEVVKMDYDEGSE